MVDFSAKEAHFFDHLLPIWRAIPPADRGLFYVPASVREHATARGLRQSSGLRLGLPTKTSDNVTVVASWGDLRVLDRTRRRAVLAEHGAGQSYSNRHTSYAGGQGRDRVRLFLVPNVMAAARNRRYYPRIPNAVIGSPRVDYLSSIEQRDAGQPVAAISFHWRALERTSTPEAGSSVDHFSAHLADTRRVLADAGVILLGHAHPRIMAELEPIYRRAGIRPVASFETIVRVADLYAIDNSSTLFEFAALGRPVVVLNSPDYRRDVEHGLRFWRESTVGLHVDHPGDLAATILEALEDRPEVRQLREDTIDRVYPVRDGTSAARGATAVRSLARGRCLVCGAAHSVCGGTSATTIAGAVDIVSTEGHDSMGTTRSRKRTYRNPEHPSTFLRLNDIEAARLGLLPTSAVTEEVAPYVEDPSLGLQAGPDPVPGEVLPPEPVDETPAGALAPGGVTHRARAKAAADTEPSADADAPPADPEAEPRHKKVDPPESPAPRTRRRRVADNPQA